MTRKHFKLIAETIRALPDLRDRRNQADRNPRFDRVRFLKACGV